MLVPLGRFEDPDNTIGFRVLPIIDVHPPVAYLTLADGLEVKTDDPAHLALLIDKATKARRALLVAYGWRECDACGQLVARTWERPIWIGGRDDCATEPEQETVRQCQVCAGISDEDVETDDSTINLRGAA